MVTPVDGVPVEQALRSVHHVAVRAERREINRDGRRLGRRDA
jgi:hypothetical protein